LSLRSTYGDAQTGPGRRQRIFGQLKPLGEPLAALYRLWGKETPTLYDRWRRDACPAWDLPVAAVRLTVDNNGVTVVVHDRPTNAVVGLEVDPAAFFAFYMAG